MLLAATCQPPGTCWAPVVAPWWVGLIFAVVVVAAGFIVFAAENGKPHKGALAAWLVSVVVFAVFAGLLDLYTAASAPK